eukprot:6621492-Lingulodinium_polyedra.AAC.1
MCIRDRRRRGGVLETAGNFLFDANSEDTEEHSMPTGIVGECSPNPGEPPAFGNSVVAFAQASGCMDHGQDLGLVFGSACGCHSQITTHGAIEGIEEGTPTRL